MNVLPSLLFSLALVLAVVLGPQMRQWSWGPSLVPLGLALLAVLPAILREKRSPDSGRIVFCVLVTAWFVWRAWASPVGELAMADGLLLTAAVGSFLVTRAISGNPAAERTFVWILAALLLASVVVVGRQVVDPSFSPVFSARPVLYPSGFYGHYNEGANFLIGASFLVAGAAAFGGHGKWTRLLWWLIAVAGICAVYFTRSRGGILAAAVGIVVFASFALAIGWRRRARWFRASALAFPVVALVAIGLVYQGWTAAQQLRFGAGAETVADNSVRLNLLGIAFSCINLHPWLGGGSRSFSWECYPFWNPQEHGWHTRKLEFTHNELVQAATDYGLAGALLLSALLGTIVLGGLLSTLFGKREAGFHAGDACRLGGLAGLAGMFVQSSFSFVFHLLPGAILLGICLGRIAFPETLPAPAERKPSHGRATRSLLAGIATVGAVVSLWFGINGSRVMSLLWPVFFEHGSATSLPAKIDRLTDAIAIWPLASLHKERAILLQRAAATDPQGPLSQRFIQEAIGDYEAASRLHAYDGTLSINLANLYSLTHRDAEAEAQYEKTLQLEGGMEAGFKAHRYFANHLLKRGLAELASRDYNRAIATFEMAREQFRTGAKKGYWQPTENGALGVAIVEGLGTALESSGKFDRALAAYEEAAAMPMGISANFRAGVLLGKIADSAWMERRPSEALGWFQEARRRIAAASELPVHVTAAGKAEVLAALDAKIQLLLAARIQPSKPGE